MLINFFKKYLLVLKIKKSNLYFYRKFKNIKLFLNILRKNSLLNFYDPIQKKKVFLDSPLKDMYFNYIYFLKSVQYAQYKTKRKRRLKRKISKMLLKNQYLEF